MWKRHHEKSWNAFISDVLITFESPRYRTVAVDWALRTNHLSWDVRGWFRQSECRAKVRATFSFVTIVRCGFLTKTEAYKQSKHTQLFLLLLFLPTQIHNTLSIGLGQRTPSLVEASELELEATGNEVVMPCCVAMIFSHLFVCLFHCLTSS